MSKDFFEALSFINCGKCIGNRTNVAIGRGHYERCMEQKYKDLKSLSKVPTVTVYQGDFTAFMFHFPDRLQGLGVDKKGGLKSYSIRNEYTLQVTESN